MAKETKCDLFWQQDMVSKGKQCYLVKNKQTKTVTPSYRTIAKKINF